MFRVTKNHLTTVLTLAALLAVVFFSAGQAEAGTQMPPWKKSMMYNAAITPPAPAPANDNQVQLVEEAEGPDSQDNGSNGGQAEMPGYGDTPGTPGNGGKAPAAAPSPSAVAGGLAMLGLIAGRRRRHADPEAA